MEKTTVRIPPITNVETAVRIFWECPEISNPEMRELFGSRSTNTFSAMKKLAREYIREKNYLSYSATRLPTYAAFEAWGLDINDLEKRLEKLKKLGYVKSDKPEREVRRSCG